MSATGGLGVARLDALVALAAERAAAGDRAGARDAYRDAVEDLVQFGLRCESIDAGMALLERIAQDLEVPV